MHLLQYFLPTYFFCKCIQRNHMKLPHLLSHTLQRIICCPPLIQKRRTQDLLSRFLQCLCTDFITYSHHHQIYYRVLPVVQSKWLANSYNIRWVRLKLICLQLWRWPLLLVLFSYQMLSEWPWSDRFRNTCRTYCKWCCTNLVEIRFMRSETEWLDLFPLVRVTYDFSNPFVASISLISRERDRFFFLCDLPIANIFHFECNSLTTTKFILVYNQWVIFLHYCCCCHRLGRRGPCIAWQTRPSTFIFCL